MTIEQSFKLFKSHEYKSMMNECPENSIKFCINNTPTKTPDGWGYERKIIELRKRLKNDNGLYEVISLPCKVYFDIDIKPGDDLDVKKFKQNDYLDQFKNNINEYFPNAEYAISGSVHQSKISYHVILTNYIIKDERYLNQFKHFVKNYLIKDHPNIDENVYTKNRQMKFPNQSKKDGRVQKLIEGTLDDNIISIIGDFEKYKVANIPINYEQKYEQKIEPIDNNPDSSLTDFLNKLLKLNYNWTSEKTDDGYKFMHDSEICLVNGEMHNSINHSCLYLNKTNLTARCHSHQSKKYEKTLFNKLRNFLNIEYDYSKITDISDVGLAEIYVELYGDDIIYHDKCFYVFNGHYWKKNNSSNIIYKNIIGKFRSFFLKGLDQISKNNTLSNELREHHIKKLTSIYTKLGKKSTLNSLVETIATIIERDNIIFENNPYLFCFNNCVFDIRTGEKVDGRLFKDSYLYLSTNYDYCEPTQEELDNVNNAINDVFVDEAERDCYLTILSTGLQGKTLEKFSIANGGGGNGKGFINELLESMLGSYFYLCQNSVLLNPIKQGANPEVASLNHKRAIIYREPDTSQNQKLNLSTIKELTGGSKLNARMCNSNDTNVHLYGTHILECNEKPNIAGRIDRSAIRRFIDIPFRTTFVSNIQQYESDFEISEDEIIKQGNDLLKNQDFKIRHRNAFFKILMDKFINYYSNGEKIDECIPQSIIDNTNEYLAEGDFIKTWFYDNYEKGQADDYIPIKELYADFKQGDYYSNMTKQGKRELNNKKFLNEIKMSITLRRLFRDRHRYYIDGKQVEKRNVIFGYIKKEIFIPDELD